MSSNPGGMKNHRAFIMAACVVLAAALPLASTAAGSKAPPGTPTAAEQPFVTKATSELQNLYGTTAQAKDAGYFRYNNEDKTGAISWVNLKYWKSDETHPSQLWYDVKGHLIGVDYAMPWTDAKHPPMLWGIQPSRWFEFPGHVHYAVELEDSSLKYGGFESADFKKLGGDPDHPTAADIVKAKKAPTADDVAFVFPFRHVWDLEFWLVPNPNGVFATKNPIVHPSHPNTSGM